VALPNWSIQRLVVAAPEYRRAPLVLFTETSNRGQLVTAASPRAQLSGVRVGMPLAEAKSLLRRAAGSGPLAATATFLAADPTADRRALDSLARMLQDFSPLVGALSAPGSSGELQFTIWLDLTGVAHLFGDLPGAELNLLRAVRDRLARLGYLALTAAADTPGAAWALANYARPARSETSTTSEPAEGGERSDSRLPLFEPIIAPLKSGWTLLDPLPPVALRLDPLICLTLGQLGISRIGQMRQLPRASLQARFGSQLGRRLDEVAGLASEVWAPLDESLDFAIDESFDFPRRDLATIQVVIERQLDQLCARLRPLQRGALQWQITLRGESVVKRTETSELELEATGEERVPETSRQPVLVARMVINLFQQTATVAHVMQLIAMQLERKSSGCCSMTTRGWISRRFRSCSIGWRFGWGRSGSFVRFPFRGLSRSLPFAIMCWWETIRRRRGSWLRGASTRPSRARFACSSPLGRWRSRRTRRAGLRSS
jgi:nucleotidyltransferase/DNA polymerase involved in DNA repair